MTQVAALGQLRVQDYFDLVAAHTASTPQQIDGHLFPDLNASFRRQAATYAAWDAQFADMASLWSAVGLNTARLSASAFSAAIDQAFTPTTSLELTQSVTTPPVRYRELTGPQRVNCTLPLHHLENAMGVDRDLLAAAKTQAADGALQAMYDGMGSGDVWFDTQENWGDAQDEEPVFTHAVNVGPNSGSVIIAKARTDGSVTFSGTTAKPYVQKSGTITTPLSDALNNCHTLTLPYSGPY